MQWQPANFWQTVIGDTMDTDIRGRVQMGYKTILILSGITIKEELAHHAFKPDLIVGSVEDIQFPLKWWKNSCKRSISMYSG